MIDQEDIGWNVTNDGTYITLVPDMYPSRCDRLHLGNRVDDHLKYYPVFRAIMSSHVVHFDGGSSRTAQILPTMETANVFMEGLFSDLPTAGIRLTQRNDMEETPVREYVPSVAVGKRLPTSLHPEIYVHDFFSHAVGAVITHRRGLEAYRKLYEIGPKQTYFNERGEDAFVVGLGDGFERYTASIGELAVQDRPVPPEWCLLSMCLQVMHEDCPHALERTMEIIAGQGMGVPEERCHLTYSDFVVPWEANELPPYFQAVGQRLTQPAA